MYICIIYTHIVHIFEYGNKIYLCDPKFRTIYFKTTLKRDQRGQILDDTKINFQYTPFLFTHSLKCSCGVDVIIMILKS